tara:strand:- start:101 stop:304 length:204 start_codon:yes stop_codon:yes gene_type:complete
MKEFVLVISMWGNNGTAWEYIGNQYVMQEKFTEAQCEVLVDNSNWQKHIVNEYYRLQFDCFHKDDHN